MPEVATIVAGVVAGAVIFAAGVAELHADRAAIKHRAVDARRVFKVVIIHLMIDQIMVFSRKQDLMRLPPDQGASLV